MTPEEQDIFLDMMNYIIETFRSAGMSRISLRAFEQRERQRKNDYKFYISGGKSLFA